MTCKLIKQCCLLFILLAVSACGAVHQPCPPPAKSDVVYVVGRGWHAEIGVPVEELDDNLAFYRNVFPGARVIMFGYGKKTFFTAPPETVSEYLLGPFPGSAAIHAVALSVTPPVAYSPDDTISLVLPAGGAKALSEYIWNDLARDGSGKARVISRSSDPAGLFYEAKSHYTIFNTCNTWSANALGAAGLPVSGDGVMFSGQVMTRAEAAARNQCK